MQCPLMLCNSLFEGLGMEHVRGNLLSTTEEIRPDALFGATNKPYEH